MITLHTIENAYDTGNNYHQFVQRGRQALLDSKALGSAITLRSFITDNVIDECLGHLDLDERQCERLKRLLTALLGVGELNKLFNFAERIYTRDSPEDDITTTRFGSWEYDSVMLEPPSLRELKDDVWTEAYDYTLDDWREEVSRHSVTTGYWEWVESQREQNPPSAPSSRT